MWIKTHYCIRIDPVIQRHYTDQSHMCMLFLEDWIQARKTWFTRQRLLRPTTSIDSASETLISCMQASCTFRGNNRSSKCHLQFILLDTYYSTWLHYFAIKYYFVFLSPSMKNAVSKGSRQCRTNKTVSNCWVWCLVLYACQKTRIIFSMSRSYPQLQQTASLITIA